MESSYFTLRYNCNRYNEDDAKAARDAQEVGAFIGVTIQQGVRYVFIGD